MVMHNSSEKLLLGMGGKRIHFRDFVFKFQIIIFLKFQRLGQFLFLQLFYLHWRWAQ
jgi:hypothetical protein